MTSTNKLYNQADFAWINHFNTSPDAHKEICTLSCFEDGIAHGRAQEKIRALEVMSLLKEALIECAKMVHAPQVNGPTLYRPAIMALFMYEEMGK